MTRPPVSLIVVANDWASARPCLDRVRARIGVRDEVLLANADEFGDDPAMAQRYPWVRLVVGEQIAVVNAAVAAGIHERVVLMDPALSPMGFWIDALSAACVDDVVAVGPRLGGLAGQQGVEIPVGTSADGRRGFGRSWAAEHRGQVTETRALARECLLVDKQAFQNVGGLRAEAQPIADLCARLAAAGGRFVIAHDAFVDAGGQAAVAQNAATGIERSGPLLSACMIVRDEADILGTCLAGLRDLVDEIVVYDTGSRDSTRDVARSAGATVIEGEWRDDFSEARNAALDACAGEWVLWVDADEVVTGDTAALRAVLNANPAVDRIQVTIDNLDGSGGAIGYSHAAARVFRRARGEWTGKLHEDVTARAGQAPLRDGYTNHVHLLHSGYSEEAIAAKGKSERNIRLAEAELAEGTDRRSLVLIHLGRSMWSAGRLDDALSCFDEALEESDDASERRLAYRHGAEALLDSARAEDALAWIDGLRSESERPEMADYLEAIARADLGEFDAALACIDGVMRVRDDDGFSIPDHVVRARRGLMFDAAGRYAEAADEMLAIVSPELSPHWGLVAQTNWRSGRDASRVARAIPEVQLTYALGQLLSAEPEAADSVVEELFGIWRNDAAVMATAAAVAVSLRVERALEWSARLRAAGLADRCPLIGIAQDSQRGATDRLLAAGLLIGAFSDATAKAVVAEVAPEVPKSELLGVLVQLSEIAPELLAGFIMAAASDPDRCLAIADALDELGASEQAVAVRQHGLQLVR